MLGQPLTHILLRNKLRYIGNRARYIGTFIEIWGQQNLSFSLFGNQDLLVYRVWFDLLIHFVSQVDPDVSLSLHYWNPNPHRILIAISLPWVYSRLGCIFIRKLGGSAMFDTLWYTFFYPWTKNLMNYSFGCNWFLLYQNVKLD